MKTAESLQDKLNRFIGTTEYHRLTLGPLVATDGVAFLAENAGAYWLVDAIASRQPQAKRRCPGFQLWTLRLDRDDPCPGAVLECRADSNTEVKIRQRIMYTDFPLDAIKLYVRDGVLMLPNEY